MFSLYLPSGENTSSGHGELSSWGGWNMSPPSPGSKSVIVWGRFIECLWNNDGYDETTGASEFCTVKCNCHQISFVTQPLYRIYWAKPCDCLMAIICHNDEHRHLNSLNG